MATNFKEGGQNTSLSPREKLKQGAANAGATVTDQSEPFAKMEKDSPAPANSHANKAVLSANITSTNQQQNLQSNKNKNSSLQPAAPQQQPTTAASEKVNDEKIQALQKMIESQADPNSIEAKILMEALSKLKLTQQTNVPKASSPIPEKPASVQNLSPIQAPSSQPQDTNNPSENSAQVNHNTTQSPQSSQNNINSHPNSPLTHDPRSKQNSGVSSASHNSSFHQYQQQIGYRQQYEKHNKKSGNPAVIPTFEQHNAYSRKVFVGGLPPDIEVNGIKSYFNQYGKVNVDWPHKNESNSLFPPKGYCFLLFHHEDSVAKLVNDCVVEDEKLYLTVNSNTIKNKQVQIRSWQNSDSDYVMDADMKVSSLDPRKTIFVGGVPRPLKAKELAMAMDNMYGNVCYAGIDTDTEYKYPKGAGRVAFSDQRSFVKAISSRFVQLKHKDIDKRVEVKPYVLDDQLCDECHGKKNNNKFAFYFCASTSCLQYYCEFCWGDVHHQDSAKARHEPMVKEGSEKEQIMQTFHSHNNSGHTPAIPGSNSSNPGHHGHGGHNAHNSAANLNNATEYYSYFPTQMYGYPQHQMYNRPGVGHPGMHPHLVKDPYAQNFGYGYAGHHAPGYGYPMQQRPVDQPHYIAQYGHHLHHRPRAPYYDHMGQHFPQNVNQAAAKAAVLQRQHYQLPDQRPTLSPYTTIPTPNSATASQISGPSTISRPPTAVSGMQSQNSMSTSSAQIPHQNNSMSTSSSVGNTNNTTNNLNPNATSNTQLTATSPQNPNNATSPNRNAARNNQFTQWKQKQQQSKDLSENPMAAGMAPTHPQAALQANVHGNNWAPNHPHQNPNVNNADSGTWQQPYNGQQVKLNGQMPHRHAVPRAAYPIHQGQW